MKIKPKTRNFLLSDRHETLMAVSGEDAENPGDRMAVTSDLGNSNNIGKIQGSVEAVTVEDLMERIKASSYIIKTDIQKYDCKVILFSLFLKVQNNVDILQAILIDDLISAGRHIPFLFMEWDNSVPECQPLSSRLRARGYRGFVKM